MCFFSMPKPEAPGKPPTERDGALDALREQQRRAQGDGFRSTIATSPLGVTGQAPVDKPTLGR